MCVLRVSVPLWLPFIGRGCSQQEVRRRPKGLSAPLRFPQAGRGGSFSNSRRIFPSNVSRVNGFVM